MRMAAKLTFFPWLTLQQKHLFLLPVFSTTECLGETGGKADRQAQVSIYIYSFNCIDYTILNEVKR
jgi:hypothetical protein